MTAPDGHVRPEWAPLVEVLNRMGPAGLSDRWQEGLRLIHDNGVTYNVYGDPRSAAGCNQKNIGLPRPAFETAAGCSRLS
jgi:uncharacterized circularly permuted ATP-grasp superfamily protein